MMQAKADALIKIFEAAVVKALKDTVVGERVKPAASGDIESGDDLVEELSEAVLWGLVEDARRLLSKRLGPLLREAADAIAIAANRRICVAKNAAGVGVAETHEPQEMETLLPFEKQDTVAVMEANKAKEGTKVLLPLEATAADVKNRLQRVLEALGKVLDGSLDKEIGAKVRCFGSSLLDKHSGEVKQLGALRKNAAKMERKIKRVLAGSPAAIGTLGLRPAFDAAISGPDLDSDSDADSDADSDSDSDSDSAVGMDLAAFKAFAKAVHLEADEQQLETWHEEMVEVTAKQTEGNASDSDSESDRQVTFAELEAWLQSQQSDAGGVVAKWAVDRRTDQFLPKGALGLQLCKDRIKTALSGVTRYSKAGYCKQLCRVVTTSRDQLTTHENELAYVSLHRPTAYKCADRVLTSLQPDRYLQETLDQLAQNAPTALNWLDFFGSFQAMLQARCMHPLNVYARAGMH